MGIATVVMCMKRKARHLLRKYADDDANTKTALAMCRDFNNFIQPVVEQGYVHHYNATFHMTLEDNKKISRICKMELAMNDTSPVYYFEVELETTEDYVVAYERAMGAI